MRTGFSAWATVDFDYEYMGEHALLLRFGACIDADVNARVHDACRRLRANPPAGLEEMVPAYASVLLRFAPASAAVDGSPAALDHLLTCLRQALAADPGERGGTAVPSHCLPVCYGGPHGPDLDAVAQRLRQSPEEIVARHCAATYTVAMLGFAPGFAYLLGMDAGLQVPRLAQPRTRVPAGSVGIGGAQTGIYPAELPGGWQLIGRTPWRLFDRHDAAHPCRLAPGDRVRFEPIDAATFDAMAAQEARA